MDTTFVETTHWPTYIFTIPFGDVDHIKLGLDLAQGSVTTYWSTS